MVNSTHLDKVILHTELYSGQLIIYSMISRYRFYPTAKVISIVIIIHRQNIVYFKITQESFTGTLQYTVKYSDYTNLQSKCGAVKLYIYQTAFNSLTGTRQ